MPSHRPRVLLAAGILAVLLVAGGLTPLPRRVFLLDAVLMVVAFGVPAWWIGGPEDVLRAWPRLLAWVLALTAVWDLASATITDRAFLSEWWLVYPSGVIFFSALYLLQGWAVRIITRERPYS
ncbi:MAG: hypothetical protein P8Z36_00630 [Gemmatimonadota bacterium]|jgi:hypothetical protein